MKSVTLGRSDALLVKEALETVLNDEGISLSAKDDKIKILISLIDIQLSEEEIRSPLRHIWKPM
tara:strand:- start:935 stop:1126 length:192 start_codon:yes stop_codon:yes gene_type:complete